MAGPSEATSTAPCELLDWDSEHFGFPIARVLADTLTESSVEEIDAWCFDRGIRCLYFAGVPDESETSRLAAAHGFQVVDVRIITRRSYEGLLDLDPGPEEVELREATDTDLEYARRLAARAYHGSRFYFDGRFPKERCDALYEAWVERAVRDPERRVLIPVVDGEPVGFYLLAPIGPGAEGHGELVAIEERHRGKGYARAMYFGAYRYCAERGVRRQRGVYSYRNLTAIRLHEKIGFLIDEVEVWHHKWYGETEAERDGG
jgi:GNAT superfamily N-acetyltransferase